jgi:hypothetical protein
MSGCMKSKRARSWVGEHGSSRNGSQIADTAHDKARGRREGGGGEDKRDATKALDAEDDLSYDVAASARMMTSRPMVGLKSSLSLMERDTLLPVRT